MHEQLKDISKHFPYIFLFGTGKMALPLKRYMDEYGIPINGMIVSKKTEAIFDEVPVYELDEVDYEPEKCLIVMALLSKYHDEVITYLGQYGFNNFFRVDDVHLRNCYAEFNIVTKDKLQYFCAHLPEKQNIPISWEHVLIIRLDGIGDTVLMTPLLRELRRNHPESHITLLTSEASCNLFEVCPYVNEVISVHVADISQGYLEEQLIESKKFMEKILHGRKVDVTMVPRWDSDDYGASFLSLFSGAQYSVAYSENVIAHKREKNKNYDLMFSHVIEDYSIKHETERNVDLLRSTGCRISNDELELWCDEEDKCFVNKLILDAGIPREYKVILVGLDAGLENKKWDYDRYAELISRCSGVFSNIYFVLLGGYGVYNVACEIKNNQKMGNITNLVGKLTLRHTFALAKRAFMYVGNDTGIMHIAATAGNRVLEISSFPKDDNLYESTTYRFRPWGVPYYIAQPETGKDDCRGCCHKTYAHCINDVTVDEVFEGFKKMLKCDAGGQHG